MGRLTNLQRVTGVGFVVSALLSAVLHVVQINEGYSEKAYKDGAGVWTICYGETKGVKPLETRSKADCDAQLRRSIASHAEALVGLPEGLPDVVLLGVVDTAYNIGVYGFRDSGMYRALGARDYAAAGTAVLRWKYISHKNPYPQKGWTWNAKAGVWRFDCSQYIDGAPNKVCYGLWKRRVWQAQALSNGFRTVQDALAALPK